MYWYLPQEWKMTTVNNTANYYFISINNLSVPLQYNIKYRPPNHHHWNLSVITWSNWSSHSLGRGLMQYVSWFVWWILVMWAAQTSWFNFSISEVTSYKVWAAILWTVLFQSLGVASCIPFRRNRDLSRKCNYINPTGKTFLVRNSCGDMWKINMF
jgi:hypothetical protein